MVSIFDIDPKSLQLRSGGVLFEENGVKADLRGPRCKSRVNKTCAWDGFGGLSIVKNRLQIDI